MTQIASSWFLVLGSWFLVLGSWFLVLTNCIAVGIMSSLSVIKTETSFSF